MILFFIAPAMIYYSIFIIYPILATVFNSFHNIAPKGGRLVTTFVGLKNFTDLFNDEIFGMAVQHTLIWAIIGPVMEMLTATLLAFVVYFRVPLSKFYRIAWFSPLLVEGVIVALVFKWIFNNEWGLLNTFMKAVGLQNLVHNWLGDPATALGCVIFAHYWATFGFSFVLMLTGLSTVSEELIESAAIDGASRIRICTSILLPLVLPVFLTILMLSFLGKMRSFHIVWVLTQGNPMHHTETVATYVQKRAFRWMSLDLGYPSAIAMLWFGLIMVVIAIFYRWVSSRVPRYY